jgi:hypothetical protein
MNQPIAAVSPPTPVLQPVLHAAAQQAKPSIIAAVMLSGDGARGRLRPGRAAGTEGFAQRRAHAARNLDATIGLLERGQAQVQAGGAAPCFVFASSIPSSVRSTVVNDDTLPRPAMTYAGGLRVRARAARAGVVDVRVRAAGLV